MREDTEKIQKRKIQIQEKERFCKGIPVIVAEVSVTCEELERKRPWQKRRLLHKGEKLLKTLGADVVVPTVSCSRGLGILAENVMAVETAIAPTDMPDALQQILDEYQEPPGGKTGWVVDRECQPVCLPLLIAMSRKVQYLGIVTRERRKAESFGEVLCEEYGVDLEIQSVMPWQERESTIQVDLENGRILIGGYPVLEGRRFSLDLEGYRVDLPRLLRRYPEAEELLSPVGWCRRKSG